VLALCSSPLAAAREAPKNLTTAHAIVLGIVEGVTEYLPISSTGHLLITKDLIGFDGGLDRSERENRAEDDAINAYLVVIQFGAILAILFVCQHRFRKIFSGLFHHDAEGRQLLGNLVIALMPAVVAGLLLERYIKTYLFGASPVILAWFFGGLVILGASFWYRRRGKNLHQGRRIEEIGLQTALLIGCAQCLAMWPGFSRSLATILGALLLGVSMEAAVEFSFLLGAVTLSAATAYDVVKHGGIMLANLEVASMTLGLLVAFVSAVFSVKWMIRYLNRYGLELFGYYRIAIAIMAAWVYLA
jgi:undecaprenyl-diphosphatase